MTEHSSSEDRSHTGGWITSFHKTVAVAVAEANKLGLQPGTVVTVVFHAGEDSPVLMYYSE